MNFIAAIISAIIAAFRGTKSAATKEAETAGSATQALQDVEKDNAKVAAANVARDSVAGASDDSLRKFEAKDPANRDNQ